MVAVIVVGLWLVVVAPLGVAGLVARRRSSLADFEASIRGLDRTTMAAAAVIDPGPNPGTAPPSARRSSRDRVRRQQSLLGVGVACVGVTLAVAVVNPSRGTLALHAAADHCLVAYWIAIVATGRYPARPANPGRPTGPATDALPRGSLIRAV